VHFLIGFPKAYSKDLAILWSYILKGNRVLPGATVMLIFKNVVGITMSNFNILIPYSYKFLSSYALAIEFYLHLDFDWVFPNGR
jgi:hypothetical protein